MTAAKKAVDGCVVYSKHGNAYHYFDYTPEALEAEAHKLRVERGEVMSSALILAKAALMTRWWAG